MKVYNYHVVTAFDLDSSVVLTCGPALKAINNKLGGRLITVNTPDEAPPTLPRVVLKMDDAILNLSLDRVQITTTPPPHVANDIQESAKFAEQRATTILEELLGVLPAYKWSGLIVDLEYPTSDESIKSSTQAVAPVFDQLMKMQRGDRDLSSFELQYGFQEDGFFVTYTIKGYEKRDITISAPASPVGGVVMLDPKDFPLSECGVEVLVDVNNKPSTNSEDALGDIQSILRKQVELVISLPTDTNLEGVLE